MKKSLQMYLQERVLARTQNTLKGKKFKNNRSLDSVAANPDFLSQVVRNECKELVKTNWEVIREDGYNPDCITQLMLRGIECEVVRTLQSA